MNGKHVPVENKKLIIEILRWARLITDAGGGHVMFVPRKDALPSDEQKKEESRRACHDSEGVSAAGKA